MENHETIKVLSENIEKEVLDRMPEWFRILRHFYLYRRSKN